MLAREAEARKEVEEAKRLAEEARAKLQAELQKQAAAKNEPNAPPSAPAETTSSTPNQPPEPAALNIPAIALTCPDAVLSTEPLQGGRSKVSVQSPCRRGQTVSLQYGPITMQRTLDDKGNTAFIADMFLGADAETSVSFVDGKRQPLRLGAGDLNQVTKVAIIWDAPVNLGSACLRICGSPGRAGRRLERRSARCIGCFDAHHTRWPRAWFHVEYE